MANPESDTIEDKQEQDVDLFGDKDDSESLFDKDVELPKSNTDWLYDDDEAIIPIDDFMEAAEEKLEDLYIDHHDMMKVAPSKKAEPTPEPKPSDDDEKKKALANSSEFLARLHDKFGAHGKVTIHPKGDDMRQEWMKRTDITPSKDGSVSADADLPLPEGRFGLSIPIGKDDDGNVKTSELTVDVKNGKTMIHLPKDHSEKDHNAALDVLEAAGSKTVDANSKCFDQEQLESLHKCATERGMEFKVDGEKYDPDKSAEATKTATATLSR